MDGKIWMEIGLGAVAALNVMNFAIDTFGFLQYKSLQSSMKRENFRAHYRDFQKKHPILYVLNYPEMKLAEKLYSR